MPNLQEEQKLFAQGYSVVAGIDEAGRGPLAGPVVAACVVIDKKQKISSELLTKIKDSKKLNAQRREEACALLFANISGIGVGLSSQNTIDEINILAASFLAMKKAFYALRIKPNFVLVDGNRKITNFSTPQKTIIKGDNKSFSIAAASIVAKVARDKIMMTYHDKYPEYGFDKHKGYGTKAHIENLQRFGPCAIHRQSFKRVKELVV